MSGIEAMEPEIVGASASQNSRAKDPGEENQSPLRASREHDWVSFTTMIIIMLVEQPPSGGREDVLVAHIPHAPEDPSRTQLSQKGHEPERARK